MSEIPLIVTDRYSYNDAARRDFLWGICFGIILL